MSMQTIPTYDDAHLVLKLYELRREEKLRAAREWFVGRFFPRSGADIETLYAAPGNENVYFRMVTSFWDMAASFVVRGVLNADLLLDSSGEMVLVWAKLEDHIGAIRGKIVSPMFLSNLQKVMEGSEHAKQRLEVARQNVVRLRERAASHPQRA